MRILTIDTSNNKDVFAKISINDKEYTSKSTPKNRNPESIVNLIEKVLKKANLSLSDIDKIEVNEGPGSYTGLKVGASVANALSFALKKKVNDKNFGEIIEPKYD